MWRSSGCVWQRVLIGAAACVLKRHFCSQQPQEGQQCHKTRQFLQWKTKQTKTSPSYSILSFNWKPKFKLVGISLHVLESWWLIYLSFKNNERKEKRNWTNWENTQETFKIDHNLIAQVKLTNMACELKINIKLWAEMCSIRWHHTHTHVCSV